MDERAAGHYRQYGCGYNWDILDIAQQVGMQPASILDIVQQVPPFSAVAVMFLLL
jgi:hypothetical protein